MSVKEVRNLIDAKDHSAVLELNKKDGLLKFLLSIGQSNSNFAVNNDMHHITKNIDLIRAFIDDIPGFKELLDEYSIFVNYSEENSMDVVKLYRLVPGSPSEETKNIVKKLNLKHKVVARWTRELSKTVFHLRETGEIKLPQANPNRKGKHYLAALKACSVISELWYVKEVKLFGSVAKGTERADSDVDINIETFDGRAAVVNALRFIERDLSNKLKLTISFLIQTPLSGKKSKIFFQEVGFFEASETLFKRNVWEFSISNMIVSFSETDYQNYSFKHEYRGKEYYCLKFNKENKTSYVVIINDKPVAYCNGRIRAVRRKREWPICVPDIIASSRKLLSTEEIIIECLIKEVEDNSQN